MSRRKYTSRRAPSARDQVEFYVEQIEEAQAQGDDARVEALRQEFAERLLAATREAYAAMLVEFGFYTDRSEFESKSHWPTTFWIEDGRSGWARLYAVLISTETGFVPSVDYPFGWDMAEQAGDRIAKLLHSKATIFIEGILSGLDVVVVDYLDGENVMSDSRTNVLNGPSTRSNPKRRYTTRAHPSVRGARASRRAAARRAKRHQRRLILQADLVENLDQWHGGQGSAVYSLSSTGASNYVSQEMIRRALVELEHMHASGNVADPDDDEHLGDVIAELDMIMSYPEESDAVTAYGVAEEDDLVSDGLEDIDDIFDEDDDEDDDED